MNLITILSRFRYRGTIAKLPDILLYTHKQTKKGYGDKG